MASTGFNDNPKPYRAGHFWFGFEKAIDLADRTVAEADAPSALRCCARLGAHCRDRPHIEMPKPLCKLAWSSVAQFHRDAAEPRGNRRLSDARIG
jgi:hypothetical protein